MPRVGFAACLLLLAGCGFHLRGSGVDATVESAYVRADRNVAITNELTRVLRQSGVDILDSPEHAAVVIDLLEQQESDRTVSYTERATTAEIQLEQAVRFQIDGPNQRCARRGTLGARDPHLPRRYPQSRRQQPAAAFAARRTGH